VKALGEEDDPYECIWSWFGDNIEILVDPSSKKFIMNLYFYLKKYNFNCLLSHLFLCEVYFKEFQLFYKGKPIIMTIMEWFTL